MRAVYQAQPPVPPSAKAQAKAKKKKAKKQKKKNGGKFFLDTVTDGMKKAKSYFDSIAELLLLVGILRKTGVFIGKEVIPYSMCTKKQLRDHIPYDWSKLMGGTQYPTIRLAISKTNLGTTAATAYTTVRSISAASLLNFSDLASVFDEYRVIGSTFELYPNKIGGTMNSTTASNITDRGFAVIDYASATALTSTDDCLAYDTVKAFSCAAFNHGGEWDPQKWEVIFEPMPDQEWIPVGTTNTVFYNWKPYLGNNQVDATVGEAAFLLGHCDVQFREAR
jgi:hypothetical protein